jgi:hypothetical protein
MTLMIGCL